jgi:hypothetical protein
MKLVGTYDHFVTNARFHYSTDQINFRLNLASCNATILLIGPFFLIFLLQNNISEYQLVLGHAL